MPRLAGDLSYNSRIRQLVKRGIRRWERYVERFRERTYGNDGLRLDCLKSS